MIKNTLQNTKDSTFSLLFPDSRKNGMPTPMGTGFFISSDGWFITAAHVVTKEDGTLRDDMTHAVIMKEMEAGKAPRMCGAIEIVEIISDLDFALLKVDFKANLTKEWLKNRSGFPYLKVSSRELDDGESVYAFGYPLPESFLKNVDQGVSIGVNCFCPRTTSAIVSSNVEKTQMISVSGVSPVYVLDKALNYGNSGGPIVAVETGHVHAFCLRFQPVCIPQDHLKQNIHIVVPSLYGIVGNLGYQRIAEVMRLKGIEVIEEN